MVTLNDLIYNSGDIFLPEPIKKILYKTYYRYKYFYINGWSFLHLFSGMIVGYIYLTYLPKNMGKYYYKMLIIHTIWELWQLLIGMTKPTKKGFLDILVDTIMFLIGNIIIFNI